MSAAAGPAGEMGVLDAIFARRSIGRLAPPAPSPAELDLLLAAATAAPDHGELRPWEFVVIAGPGAERDFGAVFARAYREHCARTGTEVVPEKLAKEETKLGRAPLVLAALARHVDAAKVPFIEQQLAVAAACQNLLLAATALGYGSMWRTGENAYDPVVKAALGLGDGDAVVGFLYLGTVTDAAAKPPHPRPRLASQP